MSDKAPDAALTPAPPQQALSEPEPADDRNPLIPLPAHQPAQTWQETAAAIAAAYRANQRPWPHCGRGSALTDVNAIAHLLEAVSDGLTPAQAASAVGFHQTTMARWLQRAEQEPASAYGMLREALQTARDRRRRRLLGTIERASEKGPQYWPAAAWSLERGFGSDYKLTSDKTGGGVVIQIGVKDSEVTVHAGLTDEDLRLP